MIRLIAASTLLAASLAGSQAFAQGSYTHHTFCLQKGSTSECAYDSMAQCEAAKSANTDTCSQNSAPQNH
ncbi:MAG: DUF3551 domain-containing protein [Xanthobacteraceae bacterium]|jgi:hypothetical protein